MAGGDTSGWFLRLRRHRLLQRLIELDVQAAHALGEPAELHVDAAAAPRHHGHRTVHVADGPDVRGERALPHLRGLFRDPLAQLLDGVRRGGGINMKLRGLTEGVSSLDIQLDQALKKAMTPAPQTAARSALACPP